LLERTVDALTISLDDFRAGRDEVNDDLSQINSRLPAAVDLVSVTNDTKTLTVKGLADDEEAVLSSHPCKPTGRVSPIRGK